MLCRALRREVNARFADTRVSNKDDLCTHSIPETWDKGSPGPNLEEIVIVAAVGHGGMRREREVRWRTWAETAEVFGRHTSPNSARREDVDATWTLNKASAS